MRFTVQYIPLNKIKPDLSSGMTARIRKLRRMMWDCMNLLVVRKNRKDGSYMILVGNDRYDFLRKHTKNAVAPCLVDESKAKSQVKSWLYRFRGNRAMRRFPDLKTHRLSPAALSIFLAFLKEEPRFKELSRREQMQVLMMAVRYKKIVVASMKSKVDQLK
ncbi:hypothetical protein [Paenibacillus arenilitoris]|uniref:ParB/Sulfiredoxin domain-containing protein n=1 Tax=Paenibacillus arenilitoris TaxID=2772299 RepID=A0A927CLZ0_9BACL|nr:hypothetical protein [Paenibacillus arenilitoris]MBD2869257.1 hypothetical protein [Paenibacillus arenilitoris]